MYEGPGCCASVGWRWDRRFPLRRRPSAPEPGQQVRKRGHAGSDFCRWEGRSGKSGDELQFASLCPQNDRVGDRTVSNPVWFAISSGMVPALPSASCPPTKAIPLCMAHRARSGGMRTPSRTNVRCAAPAPGRCAACRRPRPPAPRAPARRSACRRPRPPRRSPASRRCSPACGVRSPPPPCR